MKYYKFLIYCFFAVLAVYAAIFLYRYHFYPDFGNGFIVGDWLINYEDGGFKRRGLSGTIIFFMNKHTGFQISWIIYFIQLLSFVIFLLLLTRIIQRKRINLFYLTLVISPVTLLSYFNDYGYLGRKEFLLFLLFILFLWTINKSKLSILSQSIILLSITALTLIHEAIFFYTPYFIIALMVLNNEKKIFKLSTYLLASGIPIFFIALFGRKINEGASLEIISSKDIQLADHNIFLESEVMNAVQQIAEYLPQYILYLAAIILSSIHFIYFLRKYLPEQKNLLVKSFAVAFFFSIPLFILAVDWGRWIQIHFVLLMLIITAALPENPPAVHSKTYILSDLRNEKYLIPVFLVLMTWGMKHCYTGFFPGGPFAFLYSLIS